MGGQTTESTCGPLWVPGRPDHSIHMSESTCRPLEVSLLYVLELVGGALGRGAGGNCSDVPVLAEGSELPLLHGSWDVLGLPLAACCRLQWAWSLQNVPGGSGPDQADEPPEAPFPRLPADPWPQLAHCPQRPPKAV